MNIARAQWPLDDDRMEGFTARIDALNAAAEAAPGFLWRLTADDGGASSYVDAFDDPRLLVNLSAWASVDALRAYVLDEVHRGVMGQRAAWFEPGSTESIVWDIDPGHEPSIEEAVTVLEAFRRGEGPARDMRRLLAPP